MEGSPADEEAPKDPAAHDYAVNVSDQEISGHRHLYVGVHVPGSGNKHSEKHKNGPRHHHHHRKNHLKAPSEDPRPVTPPSQRVQFILGEDAQNGDDSHQTHPIFSEMEELFMAEGGDMEWKETARWVKFEEDVEEGGNRWSKPHVATLSLHSLFELRSLILNGTVCLDMVATNLEEISELVLDNMINAGHLSYDKKEKVKDAMLKKHRHQFEGSKKSENGSSNKMPLIRSLADIGKIHSNSKSTPGFHGNNSESNIPKNKSDDNFMKENDSAANLNQKVNSHFMKKIPKGAEASNILVGEVEFLEKPLSAFIRLADATMLGDLTEVPVPTRFLFVLLGPFGGIQKYHEIGRSIATIMSDEVFHDVAYKAKKRDHLLAGLDEFLDAVTVLPPGEWDPNIRIEPPSQVASQENRKHPNQPEDHKQVDEEEEEQKIREADGLTRTGRLFGGLINDIKRKKPFYLSDFKDGLSMQCVASYLFIYFSCLTPIITFGGLLGDATQNRIASMESLVSGLIVGVTYGFFSGQPLTILGSTGPVLVFETIVFDFCSGMEWDYLSFRLWIGVWVGVFLLLLVAFDASAFVCYITRFTEENFATLIAVIFIIKAIQKVLHIKDVYPLNPSPCFCDPVNDTAGWNMTLSESPSFATLNETLTTDHGKAKMCSFSMNDMDIMGTESVGCHYVPNAFLMSVLLFIGTFLISNHLKKFKTALFFPTIVRNYISDFAVVVAIVSMSGFDMAMGVDTPKLNVPSKFAPTWSGRTWLIPPFNGNPVYTPIFAIVPAVLGTILIFMDQQITAVIVNRKEFKLTKGCGYHLDLLIVALLIIVCSIFGLPWFVAATVLALNHVKSLTRESGSAAPGEKPQFLGIREQRVTHIAIFLTVGMSVFMTPILKHIPMPVLYGVFLYMGVSALNGLQFFDRLLLMLMPKKYQPDTPYLRQVSINRVHLYTMVQFSCFVALWLIKSFKQTSILFPLMLVVMIIIRKLLDYVFTKKELQILDDILPEFKRHERLDDEEALHQGSEPTATDDLVDKKGGDDVDRRASLRFTQSSVEIPMINGNVMKIPHQNHEINITEEMNKSGLWNSLNKPDKPIPPTNDGLKKRHKGDKHEKRKDSTNGRERKMSLVEEATEEDLGITIKVEDTTK